MENYQKRRAAQGTQDCTGQADKKKRVRDHECGKREPKRNRAPAVKSRKKRDKARGTKGKSGSSGIVGGIDWNRMDPPGVRSRRNKEKEFERRKKSFVRGSFRQTKGALLVREDTP